MYCARYRDVSNFKESHSAAWGALASRTHRALYARLDSQARAVYFRRLHNTVVPCAFSHPRRSMCSGSISVPYPNPKNIR